MTRVLIVAYHFPPDAEVGAVRPYQIARYLPEFGIEPWVLTVEPAYAERPDAGVVARGRAGRPHHPHVGRHHELRTS